MPPDILLLHPIRQYLISIMLLKVLPKIQAADLHKSYLLQMLFSCLFRTLVGRVAQLVQRLTAGWTVRGLKPGGDEIFRACPDRPWDPPSLPCNGYRVFPGGKMRPGRAADHSPSSSAEVMEE
jgi:hypothetical protein